MKRKQPETPSKVAKQAKTAKKAQPSKKVKEVVEESSEEEVVPQKIAKKPVNKKAAKEKKVVVEEPVEDLEESEDEDAVAEDVDGEEEEEEEQDNDEEMDDEDGNEEEDNAEEPTEEAIESEEPTLPSKVKSGPIPPTISLKNVIHVNRLPRKCKQIHIVEAFAKYGAIQQIHIVTTPNSTYADIAYTSAKSALAALADEKKIRVLDFDVGIHKKRESKNFEKELMRERSVFVNNISSTTTDEELAEHFADCGQIEAMKHFLKIGYAFITFQDKSSIPAALKLHNSILNDVNIKVSENNRKKETRLYDENLTVMIRNKQEFRSVDIEKLEAIFSKCGEIDYIDVLCKKSILAFITFKTEEAAENAIKLTGKTLEDIELEVEPFSPIKKWVSVHVVNLHKDVTEDDLKNHFARAGEIENIVLRPKYAIMRFQDSDGFCKSFLYNETFLKGQMIFIEPHSKRKAHVLKRNMPKGKPIKRSFQNGNSTFKGKKPKFN